MTYDIHICYTYVIICMHSYYLSTSGYSYAYMTARRKVKLCLKLSRNKINTMFTHLFKRTWKNVNNIAPRNVFVSTNRIISNFIWEFSFPHMTSLNLRHFAFRKQMGQFKKIRQNISTMSYARRNEHRKCIIIFFLPVNIIDQSMFSIYSYHADV